MELYRCPKEQLTADRSTSTRAVPDTLEVTVSSLRVVTARRVQGHNPAVSLHGPNSDHPMKIAPIFYIASDDDLA